MRVPKPLAAMSVMANTLLSVSCIVTLMPYNGKGEDAICHGTASAKNLYVLIVVDESAIQGHFDGTAPGHGHNNYPDFFAVNGSCEAPSQGPS